MNECGQPSETAYHQQLGFRAAESFVLALTLAMLFVAVPSKSAAADVIRQNVAEARSAPVNGLIVASKIRGTVTAFSGWKNSFFLQDSTGAISVDRTEDTPVQAGDEVEVTGHTHAGLFANIFVSGQTLVLRHGRTLPAARTANYRQLQTGEFDSSLVEIFGTIHAARQSEVWGRKMLFLDVQTGDALITAYLLDYPAGDFQYLVDSQVRIKGVCGTIFNHRRQLIGLRLFVASLRQIEILAKGEEPAAIPLSGLDRLLTFHGPSRDHRVRVRGTVTYQAPGGEIFLQAGQTAVRVLSSSAGGLVPGTQAEAWGFVTNKGYVPDIENAYLHSLGPGKPPAALRIQASEVIKNDNGFIEAPFDGLLVQLKGKIVDRLSNAGSLRWALESDGIRFEAEIADGPRAWALNFEAGAEVTLTGICIAETDKNKNLNSFKILLRFPSDMVISRESHWSQSLLLLMGAYAVVLIGSLLVYLWHRRQSYNSGLSADGDSSPQIIGSCHRLAKYLVALPIIVATTSLFAVLYPGMTEMARMFGIPQSALFSSPAVLAISIAVLLRQRALVRPVELLRRACILLVILTGSLELAEGLANWWLPRSMHVPLSTALSLVLLGYASLWASSRRLAGIGQVLTVIVAFTAIFKLVGTLYGAEAVSGVAARLFMSIPSAIALLSVSIAILVGSPESGLMKTACSPRLGGLMLRRLIPAVVVVSIMVGWIRLKLQVTGLFDTRFGVTLFALSNALGFCFLIWVTAAILNRLERLKSKTEEKLLEREHQLELIFETGSMGDWTWNVEPDALSAHPSVWRLYGEPDKRGREPADWFRSRQHQDDRTRVEEELKQAQREKRPLDTEFRVVWPDSSIHWLYCRAVAIFDDSGKLRQMTGINLDITDRKMAETKLKESEVLFRELQDAMPQIVWTADERGVTEHYNRRWYEYTGLVPGQHWRDSVRGDDADAIALKWSSSIANGLAYENELMLRRAQDGALRWHLARAVPVKNAHGNVKHWFGTLTDIDDFKRASEELVREVVERRRTEQLLIAAQQGAEEANLAKSRFLATMSHEIRTPMNAILGMADLLWDTVLDRDQREYVGRFRRAGANLLSLINDILDLSKIESGRLDLEAVDFDLPELVDRVMEMATPAAKLKGLSLQIQMAPGTPASLVGDPVRLQQILNNLIGNAIKFTASGNVILAIGEHTDCVKGHLQVAVSDTGIGIPADKLQAIFEDFTQAESHTTRRFGGTGLGLGICRRLVEKMSGVLTVESVLDQGSTFRFDATFLIGLTTAEAAPKELSNLAGKRVLVVDDDATNRMILCEMCAAWGLLTSAAASATEALRLFTQARESNRDFALILLDRGLPDSQGFDTLRHLKRLDTNIPVIISSSDNESGELTESKRLGAAAYLIKPIRRADLRSCIFEVLSTDPGGNGEPPLAVNINRSLRHRILLAEDSEDNRFLVQAYLAGRGYQLTFVENGQEAVDAFTHAEFDLILMDLQMPLMDGLSAAKQIRRIEQDRSQRPTVIVALTANALVEDTQRSREAGCDAHLVKPISKHQLIAAIEGFQNQTPVFNSPTASTDRSGAPYVINIPPGFEAVSRSYIKRQLAGIPEIRSLVANVSLSQLGGFGHKMKGTGTSFGFEDLSALGAAIEEAAAAADLTKIKAHVVSLEQYVRYAVDSLCPEDTESPK